MCVSFINWFSSDKIVIGRIPDLIYSTIVTLNASTIFHNFHPISLVHPRTNSSVLPFVAHSLNRAHSLDALPYIYILNEHLFIERNKFNGIFYQHVSQHFVAVQMCSIEWMCDYDMMFLEQNEEKDWFRKKMTSSSETVWWLISKLFIRRCLIFASMHKCARFTVCVCMYVYFFVCVFFFLLSFTNALIPLSQSCYFDQPAWT